MYNVIISRWGVEQVHVASSFGFISLLTPVKVARSHAHGSWGKSPVPSPQ